jgi:hypothetical protein
LKTILLIAASGIAVGGLYAGGAFDRGKVYDLPIADARARLSGVQIPQMAAMTAGGSGRASFSVKSDADKIRWQLNGDSGAVFTATLTAEGSGRTRVRLNYEPASRDGQPGSALMSTRFIRGFAETGFAEEVDARLEGRVADQAQAMRDFAREVASDPEAVRELGVATGEMFKSVSEQLNATMVAERREPTARQRMHKATEPMTKLPVQRVE